MDEFSHMIKHNLLVSLNSPKISRIDLQKVWGCNLDGLNLPNLKFGLAWAKFELVRIGIGLEKYQPKNIKVGVG